APEGTQGGEPNHGGREQPTSLRFRNAYAPSKRTSANEGTPRKTDIVATEPTSPTTAPAQIRAPASRSGSAVMTVDLTRGDASSSGPLRTASGSEGCRLRGVRR